MQQDEMLLLSPPKHPALFEQQLLLYRAPTLKSQGADPAGSMGRPSEAVRKDDDNPGTLRITDSSEKRVQSVCDHTHTHNRESLHLHSLTFATPLSNQPHPNTF